MNIFVSYTIKDGALSTNKLRQLENLLSTFSKPYIDLLHNRSLSPQEYVLEMLKKSDAILALVTKEYFDSEWVRVEINTAISLNIPVFYVFYIK